MEREGRVKISRRDFIAGLAALTASLTGIFVWYDLFATSVLKDHVVWPPPRNRTRLEGDEFLRLSSLLTGYSDLDAETGAELQATLEIGDSGAVNLVNLYERVRKDPNNRSAESLKRGGFFKQAENRDLASRLVAAWYTGVVEFEGRPSVAVTYFSALMFRKASSVPMQCGGLFGFWASKKEG